MIAVRLEGRLGNQLFQYAFIYAAARRLNTSFYLDKSIEKFLLPQYFEVKNDFIHALDNNIFSVAGYKNIFSIHFKRTFYSILNKILLGGRKVIVANTTPVHEALKQVQNNFLYEGHFHSESYFSGHGDEIRELYTIHKTHADGYEKIREQLNPSKKIAAIHVRRGDYLDQDIALPLSYYKKAIAAIQDQQLEYVFISDDSKFVETEFGEIPVKYISTHNEITDLQFLIHADVCILSCSSFSWWGAWLNKNKNKQVFAPKYWLGFKDEREFPAGVSDNLNFNWITV